MAPERRRTGFITAGVLLLGAAGLLALEHQSKASHGQSGGPPGGQTSGAGPVGQDVNPNMPPGTASEWPHVSVGSSWLSRSTWVAQHGDYAPVYGADGQVVDWLPAGTIVPTTGPATNGPQAWITASGHPLGFVGGLQRGVYLEYPFAGGFVSVVDVSPIG